MTAEVLKKVVIGEYCYLGEDCGSYYPNKIGERKCGAPHFYEMAQEGKVYINEIETVNPEAFIGKRKELK